MADTTFPPIQTQPKIERKINPRNIIGGAFENFFETVTGTGPGFLVNEGPSNLSLEALQSLPEHRVSGLLAKGEITGFQTPKSAETGTAQLILEQRAAVAKAESILRQSRISQAEFIAEEAVRLEVAGMPEEKRNQKLHLNTSYRKDNTNTAYHMAALHQQAKAELAAARTHSETQIPSPAKQPSALERMFEGGSGKTGGGTANLSAHATG